MNRHLSTEQLSSYLDGEIGFFETQELEHHLGDCTACRSQLESMQRLVIGVRRMERVAPPRAIAQEVRQRIAAEEAAPSWRRRLQVFLGGMAFQPALRTSAAMGLAFVFTLFLLNQSVEQEQRNLQPPAEAVVTVQTYFGDNSPAPLPLTTSEVAGRQFVWLGERWIQRGLEGEQPQTLVAARSPEGRAMLSAYSDLEFLISDGSRVVLRYRRATVELSGS